MTALLTDRLERLTNCSTRYELIAEKNGTKVLIGYTPRRNRSGIMSMLSKHSEAFVKFFQDDGILWGKRASDGGTAGGWSINFSGRTQRECYLEGELPFFIKL